MSSRSGVATFVLSILHNIGGNNLVVLNAKVALKFCLIHVTLKCMLVCGIFP